ncbi:hypothetical protein OPT61_g9800 [Boeremia exigua]|uniref:Uncharacterized protein n=1 Tax=Boeremia exigua TaxID=749465 RepID=A0ACC2HSS3_9PLEO|nr:hypothetical protein OPT61_g9800 [Boeremia exigua]
MAVWRLDARIAGSDTDGGSTADSRRTCGHQRRLANGSPIFCGVWEAYEGQFVDGCTTLSEGAARAAQGQAPQPLTAIDAAFTFALAVGCGSTGKVNGQVGVAGSGKEVSSSSRPPARRYRRLRGAGLLACSGLTRPASAIVSGWSMTESHGWQQTKDGRRVQCGPAASNKCWPLVDAHGAQWGRAVLAEAASAAQLALGLLGASWTR